VETIIDGDGIARVVLNRPEKLNACDLAMFEAVAETAAKLREDRSLRAILVSGKGRAFCTGLDVVSCILIEKIGVGLKKQSYFGDTRVCLSFCTHRNQSQRTPDR